MGAKKNFDILQVLRGIAAIAVVFFHGAPNISLFKYGYIGVDMFFVLSGFIIFYIHYKDIGHRSKVKSYILKRIIRIHPLYTILTLLYLCIIIPFGHTISAAYLFQSLLLIPSETPPLLGVAWTLQHEYLFYFLFALCLLSRSLLRPMAILWAITLIISTISSDWTNFSPLTALIFNPINLEFIMGCLIGYYFIKGRIKGVGFAAPLGVLLLIVSIAVRNFEFVKLAHPIAWGIPFALIILGSISYENSRKLKIPKLLTYLGDASYSIYLTHIISILILNEIIERTALLDGTAFLYIQSIAVCLASIALGCLCYSYIEKPITQYLRKHLVFKKTNSRDIVRAQA